MPPAKPLPDWERVLASSAHLQRIFPDAVLVGGTASALHAHHRISVDADHVLRDLHKRFDEVLAQLESVAGWTTARVKRPVLILGSLDGIETGVRQMIRTEPLETETIRCGNEAVVVPTVAEMLRIKALLILKRNATRDYLDFVALSDRLGERGSVSAMASFDRFYPQPNGESALQQLIVQLGSPRPFDLEAENLSEYKRLDRRWHNWAKVKEHCAAVAELLFESVR